MKMVFKAILLALAIACVVGCASTSGIAVPNDGHKIHLIDSTGKVTGFDKIQAALDAIGWSQGEYTILIEKGTYKENFINYTGPATITFKGNTSTKYGADVIITGRGSNMGAMRARELIELQGTGNYIFENLTLLSDLSRKDVKGDAQAEVLGFDGTGTVAAYNCSFLSHQDTLRTTGKSWFYKCYIEGDTDFIWMESNGIVALYEECEIVSVYDEYASTHATYALAPRANVGSIVGKGVVIYNSNFKVTEKQDTYLFRNPWGKNKNYYNQGAFVNVKFSAPLNPTLSKSNAMGTEDQKLVGWKVDQEIAAAYPKMDKSIGIIDAALESAEYAGRGAILNRSYSIKNAAFFKDMQNYWDLNALIKKTGWKVSKDTSKELLAGEVEQTAVTYALDKEKVEGPIFDGFALEKGKKHYQGNVNGTITLDVEGPCTVLITGYYQGEGTVAAEGQGVGYFACNNGSTSSMVTSEYTVYKPGKNKVVITATLKSYLTNIAIINDAAIKFNPVTKIALSTADNKSDLKAKKSLQFSAEVLPLIATNPAYEWSIVSGKEFATIDKKGLLTANKVDGQKKVTVRATALDGAGVVAEKTITIIPASDNEVDFTWLNNTDAFLGGVSSNDKLAVAQDAILAEKDSDGIVGTWAHNGSKLSGQGITLKAPDSDPKRDDWYIEFPVKANVPLRIDNVKINWGNCGTSNLRAYVTYYINGKNPVVIYDVADSKKGSPRTSDNPSMTIVIDGGAKVAAGDTITIRIGVHGYRTGASQPQSIDGKSPTWGTTVITGEAIK
ncbi:MAG: hypothetical protein E7062_03290 [Spirochaetaceae bacterium]|nr:hypothetical protein [Spirochaetaceae bacterium]